MQIGSLKSLRKSQTITHAMDFTYINIDGQTYTFSKPIIETLEKDLKYVQG